MEISLSLLKAGKKPKKSPSPEEDGEFTEELGRVKRFMNTLLPTMA
jgi:hypothetical protein